MGAGAFKTAEAILTPHSIEKCSYEEVKKALKEHYKPKTLVAVERHNFRERRQAEGESFSDYLAALKQLSRNCGFKDNVRLEEELMDQIIRSIREERTRAHFLSKADMTLDKVISKALADEKALVRAQILKSNGNHDFPKETVDKIQARDKQKRVGKQGWSNNKHRSIRGKESIRRQVTCFRCGNKGHVIIDCHVEANIKCYKCGCTSHMAAACKSIGKDDRVKRSETNYVHINREKIIILRK